MLYSCVMHTLFCCLCALVMFICTLYSCVLSTFDCMLSVCFCQVDMYSMQAVFFKLLIECCLTAFVRLTCTLYNMISKHMINLRSLNVNGIHGREKRNRVVEWIKTQKWSIAVLQETHLDENIENEIRNETNFAIYCSNGTSASRGVGIVINKSLNYEIMDKFTDEDGRIILIKYKLKTSCFQW